MVSAGATASSEDSVVADALAKQLSEMDTTDDAMEDAASTTDDSMKGDDHQGEPNTEKNTSTNKGSGITAAAINLASATNVAYRWLADEFLHNTTAWTSLNGTVKRVAKPYKQYMGEPGTVCIHNDCKKFAKLYASVFEGRLADKWSSATASEAYTMCRTRRGLVKLDTIC